MGIDPKKGINRRSFMVVALSSVATAALPVPAIAEPPPSLFQTMACCKLTIQSPITGRFVPYSEFRDHQEKQLEMGVHL